jgi:hypothetical protein
MALSDRQATILWQKDNRLRARFFKKYDVLWRKLYSIQGDSILEAWKLNHEVKLADVLPQDTEDLFVQLYEDTGTKFAAQSFMTTKAVATIATGWEELMEEYALTQGAQSIVSINGTNLEQAQKIIAALTNDALTLGLSVGETAAFIERGILDEWKIYGKFSSKRIARTEVVAAANEGSFLGAKSTGLKLRKVWLATAHGEFRVSHLMLHNTSVPMDQDFIVNGEPMSKPGDKSASAGNVINCRCAIAFRSDLL